MEVKGGSRRGKGRKGEEWTKTYGSIKTIKNLNFKKVSFNT